MNHRRLSCLLFVFCAVLALSGCFGGSQEQPVDEIVRTPRPTFTPTPVQPTNTPLPIPTEPTATPAPGDPIQVAADAPIAVVNSDQVNARKAPSITSDNILKEIGRGTEFRIIGKSADDEWWYVCCVDGNTAWVYYSYVDTSGAVDAVPVSEAIGGVAGALPEQAAAQAAAPAATLPPTAIPAPPTAAPAPPATDTPVAAAEPPTAAPTAPVDVAQPEPPTETPAPTEPPAPAFPFNLVAQEQFVETNNLVRIFAYVYQGNAALPGYTLRVTKDGAEMPVSATSADQAGFTWPVADPRQRFQNMKVEFPNVQAGGVWEIQLVDGSGAAAGPPASFTMTANDQNRELYVRYEKP
jgi:hypothetical protein